MSVCDGGMRGEGGKKGGGGRRGALHKTALVCEEREGEADNLTLGCSPFGPLNQSAT